MSILSSALLTLAAAAPAGEPFLDIGFDAACYRAKELDRVVFIDFFTTWCGPCKRLDEETWKDAEVVAWLEEHTVPIKVDAEERVALAKRFGVDSYPNLVFVETSGELKGRIVGFREPKAFLEQAADVLAGVSRAERLRRTLAEDPGNPDLKMELARELEREGAKAEALELFLWCWDHGDEDPLRAFDRVRTSLLLSEIVRFGRAHPPALVALRERRDAAREVLLGREPTARATTDLCVLGATLEEAGVTLEVYDALRARESALPPRAGEAPVHDPLPRLFEEVAEALFRAGRHAEVVEGYGDPLAWFDGERKELDLLLVLAPEDDDGSSREARLASIVSEAGRLHQSLLVVGEDDDAAALARALVELAPGIATWKLLLKGARKAGEDERWRSLRAAAVEALPPEQHRKLPKPKE